MRWLWTWLLIALPLGRGLAASVTNFYVDSTVGANGSGSLASPWKALTDINWSPINTNLTGGTDVILNMKRGSAWTGTFTPGTVGAASAKFTVQPYGSGSPPIFQNLHVSVSNIAFVSCVFSNGLAGNQNTLFDGSGSASFYCCLWEKNESPTVAVLVSSAGQNTKFINCTFTGSRSTHFQNQSSSAVIGITNCVFSGYAVSLSTVGADAIKSTAGTVWVDHCLVMRNGKTPLNSWISGASTANLIYAEPGYESTRNKGVWCFTQDDSQTAADFFILADLATNYGFHATLYVNTSTAAGVDLTAAEITNAQIRINSGHEIGAHSSDHANLADMTAFNILYIGAGSACAMTIAASNLTTVCTGDAGNNLNVNLASYNTITALVAFLNGLSAYRSTNVSPAGNSSPAAPWLITNVTSVDIKTAPYTNFFDTQPFLNYEVDTNIAILNARFTNYVCRSFAYPGGAYNNLVEQHLTNNGIYGARLATAPTGGYWRLSSNQVFEVATVASPIHLVEAIPFENNVSDSSGLNNTFTANGITYSGTSYRGSFSGSFDGSSGYLTRANDADFDFSGGDWNVSCYVSPTGSGTRTLYSQGTDANNRTVFYIDGSGALKYEIWSGGQNIATLSSSAGAVTNSGWQAVEVCQEFDRLLLRINHRLSISTNTTVRPGAYSGSEYIGCDFDFGGSARTNYYSGLMDNFASSTGIYFNILSICDVICEEGDIGSMYHHGELATPRSVDAIMMDAVRDYMNMNTNMLQMTFANAVNYLRTNSTMQADGLTFTQSLVEAPNYAPKITARIVNVGTTNGITGVPSLEDLSSKKITDAAGVLLLGGIALGAYQPDLPITNIITGGSVIRNAVFQ